MLSQVGAFGSTSDKIKNSFIVREHFELACKLTPKDATSRHLLGLWCFEVRPAPTSSSRRVLPGQLVALTHLFLSELSSCGYGAPPDALFRWQVAKLSWIEQKAAAALFASPPKATFEEAIGHLLAAEQTEPGFYPKNQLLLAQAYAKAGNKGEAKAWLDRCLAADAKTPEDQETLAEAAKLKI